MTGRAILDLIPPPGEVQAERMTFMGEKSFTMPPDSGACYAARACRW